MCLPFICHTCWDTLYKFSNSTACRKNPAAIASYIFNFVWNGHHMAMQSHLPYSMTRAPRTAIPSEPTEPMVAAPAVLEALALAPVAVPVPEEPVLVAVWLAVDEPEPVVAVAPVAVLVAEPAEPEEEAEPEEDAPVELLVTPALAEEQVSPALMAEQKALAAGRTSSAFGG